MAAKGIEITAWWDEAPYGYREERLSVNPDNVNFVSVEADLVPYGGGTVRMHQVTMASGTRFLVERDDAVRLGLPADAAGRG